MDSQDLLMKRLATASHNKIYPSILPKSELQLRRILLTTRLWNEVRRQQALVFTSAQNDWLFSQDSNDQCTLDGVSSPDSLNDLLSLSSYDNAANEKAASKFDIPTNTWIVNLDDNDYDPRCLDNDPTDDVRLIDGCDDINSSDDDADDNDDNNNGDNDGKNDNMDDSEEDEEKVVKEEEQNTKESYDWIWLDDGAKKSDHEVPPKLITSLVPAPSITSTIISASSSMFTEDLGLSDTHDYTQTDTRKNSTDIPRKRPFLAFSSTSPSTGSPSLINCASAELDLSRKRANTISSSQSSPSSPSFTICTSSSSSSVSTDPPAGPRSPTSPVLLSV